MELTMNFIGEEINQILEQIIRKKFEKESISGLYSRTIEVKSFDMDKGIVVFELKKMGY